MMLCGKRLPLAGGVFRVFSRLSKGEYVCMSTDKGTGDDDAMTKMTESGFNSRTLEQRQRLFCSLTLMLALAGGGWREAKAQGGMGQDPGGAVAMGPQGRMVRG